MSGGHSYFLRSGLPHTILLENKGIADRIKRLSPILEEPEVQDNFKINMATKQDLEEVLKAHKSRRNFQLQEFTGQSTENAGEFLSTFKNYCTLNSVKDTDRLLSFELCLRGTAKSWFNGLDDTVKKDFKQVQEQFNKNFLTNNRWLNSARLENRKLLSSESAEHYIADMSTLAQLVGAKDDELSKALIRGLPTKLKWHVVSFNPLTLSDTIQRILIGEATIAAGDREEINMLNESTSVNSAVAKLDARLDRLEEMFKSKLSTMVDHGSRPACTVCGMNNHTEVNCFRRTRPPFDRNPPRFQNQNSAYNYNPRNMGRGNSFSNRGSNYRPGFNSSNYNVGRGYVTGRNGYYTPLKNVYDPRV